MRGWQKYFQRVLIDKIAFFFIHMVKENLHSNCIWVHSILKPLQLFFLHIFQEKPWFWAFFSDYCPVWALRSCSKIALIHTNDLYTYEYTKAFKKFKRVLSHYLTTVQCSLCEQIHLLYHKYKYLDFFNQCNPW